MKKEQKKRKIKEKDLDKAFSLYIRNRDKCCQRCSSIQFLQCAHYHSRTARSVRFNEFNAITLCRGCHMFLEHRKTVEHRNLMYTIFSKETMDQVEKAYVTLKAGGFSEKEKQAMLDYWKIN